MEEPPTESSPQRADPGVPIPTSQRRKGTGRDRNGLIYDTQLADTSNLIPSSLFQTPDSDSDPAQRPAQLTLSAQVSPLPRPDQSYLLWEVALMSPIPLSCLQDPSATAALWGCCGPGKEGCLADLGLAQGPAKLEADG